MAGVNIPTWGPFRQGHDLLALWASECASLTQKAQGLLLQACASQAIASLVGIPPELSLLCPEFFFPTQQAPTYVS